MNHLNIKNENDHFVNPLCMSDGFKTQALSMVTDLRPPDGLWVPETDGIEAPGAKLRRFQPPCFKPLYFNSFQTHIAYQCFIGF